MIIQEVTDILEELAPLTYAEDFDNVGLLIGDSKTTVSEILVTLDTLENVVDEASVEKDIKAFSKFISWLVEEGMKGTPVAKV